MLKVIKDTEIDKIVGIPDQLEESVDLAALSNKISIDTGKIVKLERNGDEIIIRQLLLD